LLADRQDEAKGSLSKFFERAEGWIRYFENGRLGHRLSRAGFW